MLVYLQSFQSPECFLLYLLTALIKLVCLTALILLQKIADIDLPTSVSSPQADLGIDKRHLNGKVHVR